MKRIIAACAVLLAMPSFAQSIPTIPAPSIPAPTVQLPTESAAPSHAAQHKGLVAQLQDAGSDYELAAFQAYLDRGLAQQKMILNERVKAIGMGDLEAARMRQEDAIRGPDYSSVTPTAGAWKTTHDKGKQVYRTWIVGKTPSQVADAKKLYAAWLTRLDAMNQIVGNPNDVDQMPAGTAYAQAVNEFNIDNGD